MTQDSGKRADQGVDQPAQDDVPQRTRFFLLARDLLAIVDHAGRLVDLNQAWSQCLGQSSDDLIGAALPDLAVAADTQLVRDELARMSDRAEAVTFDARLRTADGLHRWLHWTVSRDAGGDLLYVTGRDITAQKQTEAALRESEQRLRHVMNTAADAIWVVELPAERAIFFNRDEFCGYGRDELGPQALAAVYGDDRQQVLDHYTRITTAPSGAPGFDAVEYRFWRRDGGLEWVLSRAVVLSRGEDGLPRQVIFTMALITERKHSEQRLAYQAHYDPVTGLPNRFLFADRLEERIQAARDGGLGFALCYVDLDRFNQINDSLGHIAGDDVLAQVAERLRRAIGPDDILARMGGDEFTLILSGLQTAEEAAGAAQRMLNSLEQPIVLAERELFVSASVGISLYPMDGADATTLLKHADNAMYRAKAAGRNSISWFVPELGRAAVARLELDNELRRAIERRQFELYYQPQVNLATGCVAGVEALIRWRHPERGLVGPGEFIAVAEESHLMAQISTWVIQEACRQAFAWDCAGRPPMRVAVNMSARQFERDDLVQRVVAALAQASLAPQRLDLEITESVLMNDPEGSARRIEQLRALGVRVSIDDFGTGYSSLAYLQRFPVDALKIDRSFVAALADGDRLRGNPTALVQAIIALAHSLGLTVVAEGVEAHLQHVALSRLGCDEAQGFLYARPTPPGELWALIEALSLPGDG